MPSFEKHCQDCKEQLGEDFSEVHIWLDEFFASLGPAHRDKRHHAGGVLEIREKWGDRAAEAGEIHIKADCKGIIPTEEQAKLWSLFS